MSFAPPRSEWRWTVAVLLLEIAAIHVSLVPQHLREAPYAGGLFIALSAAATVAAALLVICDDRRVWLAVLLLAGSAIAAYLISRSVGLPSLQDDLGDWLNPLGLGALVAEAITVLLSCAVLVRTWRGRSQASARTRPESPLATGSA